MPAPEFVSIDVVIRKTTEKAHMVEYNDEMIWLPRSQVELQYDPKRQDPKVTIPVWLAKEKGII